MSARMTAWRGAVSTLCGVTLGLFVLGNAQEAAAISCITPPWSPAVPWIFPADGHAVLAIDSQPWTVGTGALDSATCELLTRGEEVISATTEQDRMTEESPWDRLIRIIPERELSPGVRYTVRCDPESGAFDGEMEFDTRDDAEPSPEPPMITSAQAVWERGSDACCGYGDAILITGDLEPTPAEFFSGGGLIEARSEDDVVWIARSGGESSFQFWTPPLEGSLTITIVGPDGTRGEPFVVEEGEIEGKPRSGCAIATRPLPLGLALTLGWAWWCRRPRRRR